MVDARGRSWRPLQLEGESHMSMHRDRWPAMLTLEQEQILMSAGFRYDFEPGVLVHKRYGWT